MKNHWLWMLLACIAPILLIFLLPFFGITSDLTFALFLVVFFVAHLFMMRGHSHGHGGHGENQGHKEAENKTKHSHH